MNKFVLNFLFILLLIISPTTAFSANTFMESSKSKLYQSSDFAIFKDYNISLTSYEEGISTYAGVNEGLRLNFTVKEDAVNKIVFMFDNDTSTSERRIKATEIVEIITELLPKKVKSAVNAASELLEKVNSLKGNRDQDVFTLDQLRVELNLNNHILNIRVTP